MSMTQFVTRLVSCYVFGVASQTSCDHRCQLHVHLVQVVFVATANQLQNMSGPLLDRLEIIQLSGYTLEEKRHIAEVFASSTCSVLHAVRLIVDRTL